MRRSAPLLLALALGACSGDAAGASSTVAMTEDQRFAPDSLTIAAGTTVTFVNESSQAHTVTANEETLPGGAAYFASGGFASEPAARDGLAGGIVGQEASYEMTFDVAGTYEYFCIPHESRGMKGTIVVEAG
jgi:plastocyanin